MIAAILDAKIDRKCVELAQAQNDLSKIHNLLKTYNETAARLQRQINELYDEINDLEYQKEIGTNE